MNEQSYELLFNKNKVIKEYSASESEYIEKFRAIEKLCKLFPICRQLLNGQLFVALKRNATTDILMGKLKIDTAYEKDSTITIYLRIENNDFNLYLQTDSLKGTKVERIDTTHELQFVVKSFLKEEISCAKKAKFLFFVDNSTEDEDEGLMLNFNIKEMPVSVDELEKIAYNGF